MIVREPAVAGQFYAAQRAACEEDIHRMLDAAEVVDSAPGAARPVGGIVPHAGWFYSGQVAAAVLKRLAVGDSPDVVVVFGGVHRYRSNLAALFGSGRWQTPVGSLPIATRLAERVLSQTNLIVDDPYAHESEHSIEVQLPILVHLFGSIAFLPIMVPTGSQAYEVGQAVGRTLAAYDYNAVIVGTTDLTHYGPSYGFMPHGEGDEGIAWAKEENDRRFIEMVCSMNGQGVVDEAMHYRNACSSGAVAATIATAKALGATRAELLAHTHSRDVVVERGSEAPVDSVGYAGFVLV
ncbi:MAG: AmmeMemoRadiSam system protein B [Planctomycetota bacterium]|jgi:AmmeMemoRadiSam system protein B